MLSVRFSIIYLLLIYFRIAYTGFMYSTYYAEIEHGGCFVGKSKRATIAPRAGIKLICLKNNSQIRYRLRHSSLWIISEILNNNYIWNDATYIWRQTIKNDNLYIKSSLLTGILKLKFLIKFWINWLSIWKKLLHEKHENAIFN